MSMGRTTETPVACDRAYSRLRRVKNAFRFIRDMAALGPVALEGTKSKHVGPTFGVEVELIKKIKARFRNELSMMGGDK